MFSLGADSLYVFGLQIFSKLNTFLEAYDALKI